jgi:hypothetical protein
VRAFSTRQCEGLLNTTLCRPFQYSVLQAFSTQRSAGLLNTALCRPSLPATGLLLSISFDPDEEGDKLLQTLVAFQRTARRHTSKHTSSQEISCVTSSESKKSACHSPSFQNLTFISHLYCNLMSAYRFQSLHYTLGHY